MTGSWETLSKGTNSNNKNHLISVTCRLTYVSQFKGLDSSSSVHILPPQAFVALDSQELTLSIRISTFN